MASEASGVEAARAEWLAAAQADLLADGPPAVVFTPTAPAIPTFRTAHRPEYRRRLLRIYGACAGWSRPAVAPLWPWVDHTSAAFERGDGTAWEAGLVELERYVGVTS